MGATLDMGAVSCEEAPQRKRRLELNNLLRNQPSNAKQFAFLFK